MSAHTREELYEQLMAALAEVRKQEIERGVTLVGPHRDDLLLKLGQLPAKGYASHGESWSYALALRLASYDLLRAEGNEPVLVLDDVFAELDTRRRERLAELVAPRRAGAGDGRGRRRRTAGAGGDAVRGGGRGGGARMSEEPKSPEPEPPKAPEPSGVDLARVALRAAKEQAKARGRGPAEEAGAARGRPALRRARGRPRPHGARLRRSTG